MPVAPPLAPTLSPPPPVALCKYANPTSNDCSYRCYAARVELTRRKKERTDWLVSRDRAASLVQALYRRKQQIRRVNEMRAVIAAADGERRARQM